MRSLAGSENLLVKAQKTFEFFFNSGPFIQLMITLLDIMVL